jgi:putative ABC transport system substrate-binding protein
MRRREFLGALGGVALWPSAAPAQQTDAIPVIAYLDASGLPRWFDAFQRGLNELGYVPGRSIAIALRSAAGQADRLPDLAAELVHLQPKVIVASGSPAVIAARNLTKTIPIVFTFATDPVRLGLVASLARPGGNVTGQSNQAPGLVGKRLELLSEMLPGASHFGIVWSPSYSANHADVREMHAAARDLRLTLSSFEVLQAADLDTAFKNAAAQTAGVAVLSGPLIFAHRDQVAATAAQHRTPAIYYDTEYAEAGGLLSYGPNLIELHHNAATFVDRILKGANPADMPVHQPTRFKLVVNARTANELGFKIPPAIVARADNVID